MSEWEDGVDILCSNCQTLTLQNDNECTQQWWISAASPVAKIIHIIWVYGTNGIGVPMYQNNKHGLK